MFDKYKNLLIYLSLLILFIVIIYVFYTQYTERKIFNTYAENKEFVYKKRITEEPTEPEPPSNKKHNLYLYCAKWCPHSMDILDIWETFKKENKSKNINYYTVFDTEVDKTNNKDKSAKVLLFNDHVDSYPTLLFSKNKGVKKEDIYMLESKITKNNITDFFKSITATEKAQNNTIII